ncbi:hypothetical protein K491DRAFT_710921 [Lophiostoma macrostomum CBS 122681]|uniref:Zn(2)-C6 fungal-type domain-containing protein n=1 Tax=Lophiostoma macrostomum CBS 122681 TaxID=1314788 RepID=A0A6A6TQV0_9PLEO|nr:hypothetical protein K491DRAFT_710921 [Lophiostoma macrostomum CBS 122681]
MRSAIACDKCRRSKIKCDNEGIHTDCKQCKANNRTCAYNAPTSGGARRASTTAPPNGAGKRPVGQGETPQKRQRKGTGPTSHAIAPHPDGIGESAKALDPSLLTPKVWIELFEIFQRHNATELPFLHATTFRKPLKQAMGSANVQPPYSELLLLSFLALTSRFHDGLVQHHVRRHSIPTSAGPLDTAEYYANEARKLLAKADDSHKSLERVQALLMLGLHEFGMCKGQSAWLTIQSAISLAQAQGLQYETNFDDMKEARMQALDPDAKYQDILEGRAGVDTTTSEDPNATRAEIKRRTFWSCFIMDRYLSGGKYRPLRLNIEDIRVPLPISEEAFTFGRKENTMLLKEASEVLGIRPKRENDLNSSASRMTHDTRHNYHQENGNRAFDRYNGNGRTHDGQYSSDTTDSGYREGFLSCFIRSIDLWNDTIRWSCAGGRRPEGEVPPWDPRTMFHKLDKKLAIFTDGLPEAHKFTLDNVAPHAEHKSSTAYTLTHCALLLCGVMLHREYIPFLPHALPRPEGPLDPPTFPPNNYSPPSPQWWEESAAICFKSGRNCMDLLWACKEEGVLAVTPLIAFTAYEVAIIALYQFYFPNMDTHGHMRSPSEDRWEHIKKAFAIVNQMRPTLVMARACYNFIIKLNDFFRRKQRDYKLHLNSAASPESGHSSNSSYSGGGGLEEYKRLETYLKDFGALMDDDYDLMAWTDQNADDHWERADRASEVRSDVNRGDAQGIAPDSAKTMGNAPTITGFTTVNSQSGRPNPTREAVVGNGNQTLPHIHSNPPFTPAPVDQPVYMPTQQSISVGPYPYHNQPPYNPPPPQNNQNLLWPQPTYYSQNTGTWDTSEFGYFLHGDPAGMMDPKSPQDWFRQTMHNHST